MKKPIADIHLIWEMTRACNFKCPYCLSGSNTVTDKVVSVDFAVVLRTLNATGNIFEINLVGGEPSIVPGFTDLVSGLTQKHFVFLTTNLAASKIFERFADKVDPARITGIDCSFHVEQREKYSSFEKFARTWNLLNDQGFNMCANYVAHPSLLGRIEEDLKRLSDLGVAINPTPYIGVWQGKSYPESYTPDECDTLFRTDIYTGKWEAFMGDTPVKVRCNAGYNVFWVGIDGNISKCTTYLNRQYGNIYSGFTETDNSIEMCNATTCSCPYYSVLEHYFLYGLAKLEKRETKS